jgi:hypothetical protein
MEIMPSSSEYRKARELFSNMLSQPSTEREWQNFFKDHPWVLSESLPLRLQPEEIHPRGRPGRSEPDFIFYSQDAQIPFVHGVIEIKRPESRILTIPRQNIIILSGDAQTALAQAEGYCRELRSEFIQHPYHMLALGSEIHAFIILGVSTEIASKVTKTILKEQYENLLPRGFRLIPYDTLLRIIESRIPTQIYMIVPDLPVPANPIPIIDFSLGGDIRNIEHDEAHQFLGIHQEKRGGVVVWRQNSAGYCIYCNKRQGYRSLSETVRTPAGSYQRFAFGIEMGKPYRILRCTNKTTRTGMPLEFKEVYEKGQLENWFWDLTNKLKCGRCGSSRVRMDPKREYYDPMRETVVYWDCEDCGFYEAYYDWGLGYKASNLEAPFSSDNE